MASRRTQPYRKRTGRAPGQALDNMKRGATVHGQNATNSARALAAKRRRRKRAVRGKS